jgi:hypothetical protein
VVNSVVSSVVRVVKGVVGGDDVTLGLVSFVKSLGVVFLILAPLPVAPLLVEGVGMAPNGVVAAAAAAGGLDDTAAMPSAILVWMGSRFWSTVCSLSFARRSSPRKREPSSTRA